MRIYLACTVRGDRSRVGVARLIAERLTALGHENLTSHLLADDVDQAEATVGNRDVFERDVRWLDACDVLVAEASGSTYGVGFEVGYITGRAPTTGQRALVLYDAQREHAVSRMLSGNTAPACTTLAYRGLDEVAAFIDRELSSR
jgi:2'-deoxynucleoside 5'-phosphate N-hydrolase